MCLLPCHLDADHLLVKTFPNILSSHKPVPFTSPHLIDSLFGQYAGTVMAVSGATGYALYRRHPNGLGLMLVAGAAGTLVDLAYGWNVSCHSQVTNWQRHREATAAQASEKNKAKDEK